MAIPFMTLLLPKECAIGSMAVIWTHGIPSLSISFVIAAPQRVQDPQVETIIAAVTSASLSCLAMSRPKPSAFTSDAPVPTVE